MTTPTRLIPLACALAALVLPAGAQAATATVADAGGGEQRLNYSALDGETNVLEARYEAGDNRLFLRDSAGITPGAGCARGTPAVGTEVVCNVSRTDTPGLVARLDDGDDEARVTGISARLLGEDGADTLNGGDELNFLNGGNDSDELVGGGLRDRISGGFDRDFIRGGGGADRLNGGPGSDTIRGGVGRDRITGGRGTDRILGQGGGDRIFARDNLVDDISCGGGSDRVALDGFDQMSGSRCERAPRPFPPAATPIRAVYDGSAVEVLVGCSRDRPARCAGRISILRRGNAIAGEAIDIRRGRRETARLALSSARRQELDSADRYLVTVVVRSEDALGRTRIIRVRFNLAS